MSFNDNPGTGVDTELQNFILAENQRSRFQSLVHNLTAKCWDVCMNKVNTRLDSKTENCIVNCVERFIDTTNFIVNRLQKTSAAETSSSSLGFE